MEIRINHLCFGYIKRPLSVVDFSCALKNGEILSLVGGEGAGKTSLLRVVSGLEKQYAGTIFMNGKNAETLSLEERNISYIPSEPVVFMGKSVEKNFEFLFKVLQKEYDESIVKETMQKFGLDVDIKTKMKKLSSAQRKVFTIARAFIKSPTLFLIDDLFKNEKEEDCLFIKNSISTLFKERNTLSSVIMVENNVFHAGKANQYFYFSYGKNTKISGINEIEKNPIDMYALDFFKHFEKDYILYFDGYNYFLKDYELVKKSKNQFEKILKRQIKLDQCFSDIMSKQKLEPETEMQVRVAGVQEFENLSDEILNNLLKSGEIFIFDKNSFTKVI